MHEVSGSFLTSWEWLYIPNACCLEYILKNALMFGIYSKLASSANVYTFAKSCWENPNPEPIEIFLSELRYGRKNLL
jgi:hypothetical protein